MGEIHATSWAMAYQGLFGAEFFAEAVDYRRNRRWPDELAKGERTVLLAASNGRPLAFSFFGASQEHPGSTEIIGFYNHPDGWGSGVAGALMTATLDELSGHIHLWTMRDTPQSRRFYTKNGFTESGAERRHDFGDGVLLDQVEYELHR